MADWPRYESHTVVTAARITSITGRPDASGKIVSSEITVQAGPNAAPETFVPTVPGSLERASIGGWAVIREDGSRDTLRAEVFEHDYRLVGPDGPAKVTDAGTVAPPSPAHDTVSSAAGLSNVGNGTIGSLVVGPAAKFGAYKVVATSATDWTVVDPGNVSMPDATTGVSYATDEIGFKIAVGGMGFATGDNFTVTVGPVPHA